MITERKKPTGAVIACFKNRMNMGAYDDEEYLYPKYFVLKFRVSSYCVSRFADYLPYFVSFRHKHIVSFRIYFKNIV